MCGWDAKFFYRSICWYALKRLLLVRCVGAGQAVNPTACCSALRCQAVHGVLHVGVCAFSIVALCAGAL